MFAQRIRQAGLAIAALALATSINVTPASAAAPPDLQASISRISGIGATFHVDTVIRNVGGTKSAATVMQKSCGYLPTIDSIVLDWVVVDPSHMALPALNPGVGASDTSFLCGQRNGRNPVAARIVAGASQGETNLSNNKEAVWAYKFD